MTPPPPHMRYNLRRGFVDDGELRGRPSRDLLLPQEEIPPMADRHRGIGAGIIALALYFLMLLGLTLWVMHAQWTTPAPVAPVVTPFTYGWPGPTGGAFTTMPQEVTRWR